MDVNGLSSIAVLAQPADDRRGWILSSVSGAACVLGSSIICIDLVTKHIPRWRHFSIRDNSTFLSASLSLSFGVMIFSALYGILPEATVYLTKGGKSSQTAKFMSIGFFMLGVVGLSIISEVLHRSLPSSIVHCEHGGGKSHEEHLDEGFESDTDHEDGHAHHHDDHRTTTQSHDHQPIVARISTDRAALQGISETTPLLPPNRAPSLKVRLSGSVASLVAGKAPCSGDGTCYGYAESRPCDKMCMAHLKAARTSRHASMSEGGTSASEATELLLEIEPDMERGFVGNAPSRRNSTMNNLNGHAENVVRTAHGAEHSHGHAGHHHVPKNEFLSIGLQTSLAIALHKIPEGFITFATNHANPRLGFAVFLALAIHNVSEGFVMSLPLFLAFKSRMTAILWASLLGGLSQPAGALCAYLWFKSSGRYTHGGDNDGDEEGGASQVAYGILFAVTAGIMCNVALQLYGQAVGIYHSQRLPMICAFVGMGVLGCSFAVTEA